MMYVLSVALIVIGHHVDEADPLDVDKAKDGTNELQRFERNPWTRPEKASQQRTRTDFIFTIRRLI
jgi:hypothetical protein